MSERLREAARAVLQELEFYQLGGLATELRAALDAEPEPTPSDEEAAALTIAYVLTYCAGKPGQPSEAVSVRDVPERFPRPLYWVTRSYTAARTEGYAEGAEAMREQAIAWFARCLKWTGDGYEWCPVAADYREDPSELARRDLPIPRPEGDRGITTEKAE